MGGAAGAGVSNQHCRNHRGDITVVCELGVLRGVMHGGCRDQGKIHTLWVAGHYAIGRHGRLLLGVHVVPRAPSKRSEDSEYDADNGAHASSALAYKFNTVGAQ